MDKQRLIEIESLLCSLCDYFDKRKDADCDQDGYIPNEEMNFYMACETELKLVQQEIAKEVLG